MARIALLLSVVVSLSMRLSGAAAPDADARLKGAERRPPQQGWTYVRLEGTPAEIGYQHGYLLAPEIADTERVIALQLQHDTKKDWAFFRAAGRDVLWPHVEQEYRDELQGIADGVKAAGGSLDLWDVVAMNGYLEWPYYTEQHDKLHPPTSASTSVKGDHCSAFVATGSYTKDGKIVIAHNNWSGYIDGERWTIAFDVHPAHGHHFLMDGLPGLIHSADDFGLNDAGIVITETTISGFAGFDVNGIPEFVRARKAMQYSASIEDVARIFKEGNNGGYANDWLIADTKTNEIASLELGLKHVTLERKTDGYFIGSNYPIDPKLAAEETSFDLHNMGLSANARRKRWVQLVEENKGRIDLDRAHAFLADHVDSTSGKTEPSERTLCGHIDASSRGSGSWQPPFGIAGAVQNKATDATLAAKMTFTAAAGHACGQDFIVAEHLKAHPEFTWELPLLHDMKAQGWTTIAAH